MDCLATHASLGQTQTTSKHDSVAPRIDFQLFFVS
jgi:hypothetical protein